MQDTEKLSEYSCAESGMAGALRSMANRGRRNLYGLLGAIVVVLISVTVAQASDLRSAVLQGQSQTLLPNGQILLAGGYGSGHRPVSDLSIVTADGSVTPLLVKMTYPRAGHTATVLPDGHILIFGGYGADGELVPFGELFDPMGTSVSVIGGFRLLPRAFHTATLLTDGTLLVIGGAGEGGGLVPDVQIWNYQTGDALSYEPGPSFQRSRHEATLLPDGNVQIAGGVDASGKGIAATEQYDPVGHLFRAIDSKTSSDRPQIEESIPLDGATNIHITDRLAIRFGSGMSAASVNKKTITLTDPDGNAVPITVTAAESGRLAFLIPDAPLEFGSAYAVTLMHVRDAKNTSLPPTTIRFTTEANPNITSDEEWVPGPSDFKGQWHSHTGPSDWQKQPALQADEGVTALAGQVLRLDGRPLQHVSMQIDGQRGSTDKTGRFLLKNLHAGHHVLVIDGAAANRAGVTYGLYKVGIDLVAGKTTALNYTIWMTKLDMAHAISIPSPTTAPDTVITSPLLPGLELHLPQNTVIKDQDGHPVRQLTITPIPLDKPPFPLPQGVQVPIYFTIQPGGSYIDVRGYATTGIKGARLVYPNPYHSKAGTAFNFWNYDADSKGWYVYGHGKVDKAGTSVVPDPGVVVYELTGAMVGDAGGPFPFPPLDQDCKQCDPDEGGSGDNGQVDLSTGNYSYDSSDLDASDIMPIGIPRSYRTNDSVSRAFGVGTTLGYDTYMSGDQHPYSFQELIQPDGSRVRFDSISPAQTDFTNITYAHTSDLAFYGASLTANSNVTGAMWSLKQKDGTQLHFPDSDTIADYRLATPLAITDRYGNALTLTRDLSTGNLTQVTSPSGRSIKFTYDPSNRITQATDNLGRSTSYDYDAAGRLSTMTDANGGTRTYTYDNNNNLLTITDAKGVVAVSNQYDSSGRVIKQTLANQGTYLYSWTPTQNTSEIYQVTNPVGIAAGDTVGFRNCSTCSVGYSPVIAQVDITDPRGYVRRVVFDSMGRKATETFAFGQPEQHVYSYSYYSDNSLRSVTDPLGHKTTYTYDRNLNPTEIDRLAETNNPIISTFTYDPVFSKVTSATDPLGHTTTFTVDSKGNTTRVADALGHGTTVDYNGDGTASTVTDDQANSVQLGYDSGLVSFITDALGNQTHRFFDPAGRLLSVTDPAGNQTRYSYDNLGQLTQTTDPAGNKTLLSYDSNGNLTSVTDALGHVTSYTYDSMNRLITRKDPLQRQESYTYDSGGMLSTFTDRKGQIRSYTFDALGRPSTVAFGVQPGNGGTSQSTISYNYDSGNRILHATDSSFGLITRDYDFLGRLTSESTPLGSISYTYDIAGRRTSMQVNGQTQVAYTWDDADRLTGISQGPNSVGFTYDNLNRRTAATLPNGITVGYSYDDDYHLTGIDYSRNGIAIGNLTYGYDEVGNRTSMGGSLATISLPTPIASSTYDAANELTNWNGMAISYDSNGSMTNDGLHTYSWNARNQLTAIDSGGAANYQYDAFGRRSSRISNGTASVFQFDGDNPIQENTGTGSIVNLTGGGVDNYLARTDSTGTSSYLTDVLGSTVALVDGTGTLLTRYSYEPFGATMQNGASTTNLFGFTGREFDAAGLYFYRARYYSPSTGRFISEDPIGFEGGMNVYSYAENNPINFADPSGLRDIIITIWNAQVSNGAVGHAAAWETDGSTILSEFPQTHTYKDPLQTLPWDRTLKSEGRNPDGVYKVHITDDDAFNKSVEDHKSRRTWDWLPTDGQQTNCIRAVDAALNSGGVNAPYTLLPGQLDDWLAQQSAQQRFMANLAKRLGITFTPSITKLTAVPW